MYNDVMSDKNIQSQELKTGADTYTIKPLTTILLFFYGRYHLLLLSLPYTIMLIKLIHEI